jgi:hypothetical protein
VGTSHRTTTALSVLRLLTELKHIFEKTAICGRYGIATTALVG